MIGDNQICFAMGQYEPSSPAKKECSSYILLTSLPDYQTQLRKNL